MPELPDLTVYLDGLAARLPGRRLVRVRLVSPFVLRSAELPVDALLGRCVVGLRRIGKRIVIGLEDDYHVVIHLMIAGRLRWSDAGGKAARSAGKIALAGFDFEHGSLTLTEAGTKKRAALHFVHGAAALRRHDPGGIEPLDATPEQFREALTRENHTLKRSLTDPRLFAGIGNAYSDEILHAARLSPVQTTTRLSDAEIVRLFEATRAVLQRWIDRLRSEFAGRFPGPGEVTAFRPDFAVHGRYGQPCPDCGHAVQRIRYAENETNYCPTCQTEGRVLADRSLSRLLREDWPRTVSELERLREP